MDMNFFDCFYNVAALTTCILNEDFEKSWYGITVETKITDQLSVVSHYTYENDADPMGGPAYHDYHLFDIKFYRDGKYIDSIRYVGVKSRKEHNYGFALFDDDVDLSVRLQLFEELKPGIVVKMKNLSRKINLTNEEMIAFIQKSKELVNQARFLLDNKKTQLR